MADHEDDRRDPAGTASPGLGLVDGLVQLSFLIQEILSQAAVRHDLSVAQLRLLGVLRDREPGMQELARYLKLDKSSVTGLIDRAERRGLVRRTAHPQDGRAVRVAATAYGQELAARGAAEIGLVRAGLAGAVVRHAARDSHRDADTGHL
jgi:DNA-binding MarR family transcriptional regulator